MALVIGSLGAGGAERVMTLMANHWATNGRPVSLVTFGSSREREFFHVDEHVERIHLDVIRVVWNPIKGVNSLRQVLTLRMALKHADADVVISFIAETNVLTLLATRGTGVPVIVSDRVDPHVDQVTRGWRILRRLLYPRASRIVAQTDAALSVTPRSFQKRSRVIPNPVLPAPPTVASSSPASVSGRRVIAMGRLHRQKGFDLLIRAFKEVRPRHQDWSLEIWGEGGERSALESLANNLGIGDAVQLPGLAPDPYAVLRTAGIFVMSSRYEGFPNALCEAMACGASVVAFDCPSGPAEIIRNGIDGILVPVGDAAELARALDRLMSSDHARALLSARAPDITERYSVTRVMSLWDQLVDDIRRM